MVLKVRNYCYTKRCTALPKMKYLAHLENNLESRIISIYDVIKGLNGENPIEWEERTYYSLWYNTPMIAKVNSSKRKPHFAFKKGFGGNENSGGGESIEHQLSKKIISDLKVLNLKIGEIEGELKFSEIIIEQPFENGKYSADLFCKISDENNFNFPVNSMIVIELHLSNKVKKSKEKFYRNHNLTSIEINIWKEIKFAGDIEKLQRQLKGYFQKQRYAKRLHDPNWKNIIHKREEKKKLEEQLKFQQHKEELERVESVRNEELRFEIEQREILRRKKFKTPQITKEKTQKVKEKSFWKKILDYISK